MKVLCKKKIFAIIIVSVCLVGLFISSLLLAFHRVAGKAEPIFAEEFTTKTQYYQNDVFTLPTYSFSQGDEIEVAETLMISPCDYAYNEEKVILNETGKWTLRFIVTFDKTYYIDKEIIVNKKTYEVTDSTSYVSYGTPALFEKKGDGLIVNIAKNDVFKYNEPIDLTKLTLNDSLICLGFNPIAEGTAQVSNLVVRLTDIYDENNYVEMVAVNPNLREPNTYTTAASMILRFSGEENTVGAHTISNDGQPVYWVNSAYYGAYTDMSHYGYGDYLTALSFDWATQSCHSLNKKWQNPAYCANNPETAGKYKTLIGDLDDIDLSECKLYGTGTGFSKPFKGFTTGEIYLSVYGEAYSGSDFGVFIKSIYGADFSQVDSYDHNKPSFTFDLQGYSASELPKAEVGKPYKMFDCTVSDNELKNIEVSYQAYYMIENTLITRITVRDGYFTPNREGKYALVYLSKDGYGNENEEVLYVWAETDVAAPTVTLSNYATTANVGEAMSLPQIQASAFSGVAIMTNKVILNGETVAENVTSFIPEKAGEYVVEIIATDYIGQQTVKTYTVDVGYLDCPVLQKEIVLPRSFIKGATYWLPLATAIEYDAQTGEKLTVPCIITLTDATGIKTLVNGEYTANDGVGGYVSVKYTFETTTGTRNLEKEFDIPAIAVETYETDMINYFLTGTQSVAEQQEDSIVLYFYDDDRVDFAKCIPVVNSQFVFGVYSDGTALYDNAKQINILFSDAQDKDVQLLVSIYKILDEGVSGSFISVNGGEQYKIKGDFDGTTDFTFTYNNQKRTLESNSVCITIDKTLKGEAFTGFNGNKANVSFEAVGVDGASATPCGLEMFSIAEQAFFRAESDFRGPTLYINGNVASEYQYGTQVQTLTAYGIDVLQENTTCTLTVSAPNGDIVVATDGTRLRNVDASVVYTFTLSQYGHYNVRYVATDSMGGMTPRNLTYYTPDKQAPVISVDKSLIRCKVGQEVRLPTAIFEDNYSAQEKIYATMMYYNPDGQTFLMEAIRNGAEMYANFTFDRAGIWKIQYLVYDEYFNITIEEITVEVR